MELKIKDSGSKKSRKKKKDNLKKEDEINQFENQFMEEEDDNDIFKDEPEITAEDKKYKA